MALIRTDMNLVASGGYGKVWTFSSATDAIATMKAANYFNNMAAQLSSNDRIHCKATDGYYDAAVTTITAGVVTVVWTIAYA